MFLLIVMSHAFHGNWIILNDFLEMLRLFIRSRVAFSPNVRSADRMKKKLGISLGGHVRKIISE